MIESLQDGFSPQLSLGSAGLLIFAVCAGYMLLRGIARMVAAVLMLCGSAWIAFQVWQHAPAWTMAVTGEPSDWLTTALPIAAFIASLIVLRAVTKFLTRPWGRSAEDAPRSWGLRLVLMALALVPAAIFWLTGATLLHHAGSVEELRASAENSAPEAGSSVSSVVRKLRPAIESAMPDSWLRALDPMADSSRLSLAKMIAGQRETSPLQIDPETGQPIPRAIIVDEPALEELARDGRFSTLLRHPRLNRALEDPKIREMIRQHQP